MINLANSEAVGTANIGIAPRIAVAATLLWLGMVLAISFLEAPLKFRAPGLPVPIGLAIGRIVFRALNRVEVTWALILAACLIADSPSMTAAVAAGASIGVLIVQLGLVRPALNRRSERTLAGEDVPRSASHHAYVALETAKVIGLIVTGAGLLS